MTETGSGGSTDSPFRRPRVKFAQLLRLSDADVLSPSAHRSDTDEDDESSSPSATSSPRLSGEASSTPFAMLSPWTNSSPYVKSPWIKQSPPQSYDQTHQNSSLIATLLREEGHVYSLAASGDMLYTGSDARNIGVWKNLKDFGGFKSNAGLVKAIVISGGGGGSKIYTGHQDGKIRVWKVSVDNPSGHKRIGTLPTLKDYLKSSINPKNYVRVRRHRRVPKAKHFDAISCLSLNEEAGLLYSGSWDKTIKVWRLSDSKCLESVDDAHDDAINSVVVGLDGLVFSGSADGTVKAWRRELDGRSTRHFHVQTLLSQQNAVTALAANKESGTLYSGSSDGLVSFWERDGGVLSYGGVLRGHKLAVLCVATVGTLLLSGSADKSVCVWKRDEYSGMHLCLDVLTSHSGPVKCLAAGVDDDTGDHRDNDDNYNDNNYNDNYNDNHGGELSSWIVYSGSLDKSVKVWRVRA